MHPPEQRPSRYGTVALIVVGLVILIPSGLCTGIVALGPLFSAIINAQGFGQGIVGMMSTLPIALLFGGPFIAAGAAIVRTGMKRMRER